MRVSEAVEQYLRHRRSRGCSFLKGESILKAFAKCVGDKELPKITVQEVDGYLIRGDPSSPSSRSRHLTIRKFLKFWALRDAMPAIAMPLLPRPSESDFIPYIYSKEEIRSLLRATSKVSFPKLRSIDPKSFRALIITLYATGSFLGQLVRLKWEDVDLLGGFLTLKENRYARVRIIPVPSDLLPILEVRKKRQNGRADDFVFVRRDGQGLTSNVATRAFIKLRKSTVMNGARQSPRLHDLRATFAVHRINEWIKKGSDLNKLLPALSAYMGSTGLMRSERYMHLTPDRFRKELACLSPKTSKGHWRNDASLMCFLNTL